MVREKTALVLSAGGMFGAYQAGAWKALAARFRPDVVVGASVGALNGWAIAGGAQPEALIREWLDPELRSCARLRLTWKGALDWRSLETRIQRLWSACQPQTGIGVVAVDLLRLRPRLFRNQEIGWRHLMASCAVLSGYPQVSIDGRLYSDGGLLEALPLWAAAEMGASKVIAVNALPQMPSLMVRTALRAIRALARHRAAPHDLEVLTIAPHQPLGSLRQAIFWDREAIQRWIEQGQRDAHSRLAAKMPEKV